MDEEFRRRLAQLSEDEFQRLYGPWAPLHPNDAAALFAGCGVRWWIVGGWAIETFCVPRSSNVCTPTIHGSADFAEHTGSESSAR